MRITTYLQHESLIIKIDGFLCSPTRWGTDTICLYVESALPLLIGFISPYCSASSMLSRVPPYPGMMPSLTGLAIAGDSNQKGMLYITRWGGGGGVNPRLSDSAIFNISVQFQWRYLTLCNSLSLPSRVPSLSLSFSSPSPIFNVYHEVWLWTYVWKYPIFIWIQKKELGCYKSHIYIFL